MRFILVFGLFLSSMSVQAQNYFPPLSGDEWESMDPSELGYCQDKIDSLYAFLEEHNSKSFILLKDGKVVLEEYFGTYTQDSLWYWASAGKSLAGFLVGCAQEDGLLNIEDPTSDYLGPGWTAATAEQEALIKIRHQMSMTTGLADNVLLPNCLSASCLEYYSEPGERWSYYNAPYRLTQEVLESATGQGINAFTWNRLGSRIGMGGFWFAHVRYGKARDMARFGLLNLNQGIWDTDTILGDESFLFDMIHPSQDLNEAYGYLWWLNGSSSYMLPSTQIVWPGELIPSAPEDTYAALGKDDQKIYVVPSEGLVVVRQGNSAGQVLAGPSSFDNDLWQRINALHCLSSSIEEFEAGFLNLYPNPAHEMIKLDVEEKGTYLISNAQGRIIKIGTVERGENFIQISDLNAGLYSVKVTTGSKVGQLMWIKR